MTSKIAKKRKLLTPLLSSVVILISFLSGNVFFYYLLTNTTLIPINYNQKFTQIYNIQENDRFTDTYIDLAKGFLFNYPTTFHIDQGRYSPGKTIQGQPENNFNLLSISGNSGEIELLKYWLTDSEALLEFAQETEIFPFQNLRDVSYKETVINGNEAVIAEFTVTQEQKEIELYIRGGMVKVIDEPLGFQGKIVYIKHNNSVFIWKLGSAEKIGVAKDFERITNSFKTF